MSWSYFSTHVMICQVIILRQDGRHLPDIFFLFKENDIVLIIILLHFFSKSLINKKNASDNGLVPTRRQAVIWTNDGQVQWRICLRMCQYGSHVLLIGRDEALSMASI